MANGVKNMCQVTYDEGDLRPSRTDCQWCALELLNTEALRNDEGRPTVRHLLATAGLAGISLSPDVGRPSTMRRSEALTPLDRTPSDTPHNVRLLGWLTTVTGLVSIVAVVVLALSGEPQAAAAVGIIGGAVSAAGGIQVTVNIRR